jgi:hypothetical protein
MYAIYFELQLCIFMTLKRDEHEFHVQIKNFIAKLFSLYDRFLISYIFVNMEHLEHFYGSSLMH